MSTIDIHSEAATERLLEDSWQTRSRRLPRRELISEEELRSQLREQGADDVSQVKSCHLESDGQLSVIKKDEPESNDGAKNSQKQPPA